MSTHKTPKKLLAAARAARKEIALQRRLVVWSYATPPGRLVSTITDSTALQVIAQFDKVLAKLDAAIEPYRMHVSVDTATWARRAAP